MYIIFYLQKRFYFRIMLIKSFSVFSLSETKNFNASVVDFGFKLIPGDVEFECNLEILANSKDSQP